MPKSKNIQIPYLTFKQLLELLEQFNLLNYPEIRESDLKPLLEALRAKQQSIDTREAYFELIRANASGDEELQHETKIGYLKKRGPTIE